jgi:general stress protein 26
MILDTELSRLVWQLVSDARHGLLTTVDKDGWPHATWMNFETKGTLDEIFTITGPATQKVANLRANPRTEWMFSHPNFTVENIAYISGETRIIEGDAVEPYWDAIPGKSRAYYRQSDKTDDFHHFVVLVTKVTKVVLSRPIAYRKFPVLDPGGAKH